MTTDHRRTVERIGGELAELVGELETLRDEKSETIANMTAVQNANRGEDERDELSSIQDAIAKLAESIDHLNESIIQ